MLIRTYVRARSAGGIFQFPHNPNVYTDVLQKAQKRHRYALAWDYFNTSDPQMKSPLLITFEGHFDGSNRNQNFRDAREQFIDDRIKEFFFNESSQPPSNGDKFVIGIPNDLQKTHTGTRTNFIDYTGTFISLFPIYFAIPLKFTTADQGSNSSPTNLGETDAPIQYISIANLNQGDLVQITDSQGNGFQFNAVSSGSAQIYLVRQKSVGMNMTFTDYYYAEMGGSYQPIRFQNTNNDMYLRLQPNENLSSLTVGGVANSDVYCEWYDAYLSN